MQPTLEFQADDRAAIMDLRKNKGCEAKVSSDSKKMMAMTLLSSWMFHRQKKNSNMTLNKRITKELQFRRGITRSEDKEDKRMDCKDFLTSGTPKEKALELVEICWRMRINNLLDNSRIDVNALNRKDMDQISDLTKSEFTP